MSYGFSTAMQQGHRHWGAAIKGLLQSLILPVTLIQDNKTMAGYGIWNYALAHPGWLREDLAQLIQWLDDGRLQPVIARSYSLTQAEEAQDKVSRSDFPGKVVLDMAINS
ncbi:MAG: zinc-binding dehydrogenase [Pseudomonadales bacterium]|nr:zinc-binding dehydrogenase [Pseudomonadales bacterium]